MISSKEQIKAKYFKIYDRFFFRKHKIKFSRKSGYDSFKIEFDPNRIFEINKNDEKILKNKITNFIVTMKKDCKHFNLNNFVNNYKKTVFFLDVSNENSAPFGIVGFSPVHSRFYINNYDIIYHELFHLATNYYDKKTFDICSGFEHTNLDKKIGHGICEGYTQLLSERYFNENIYESYKLQKRIALIIEKLIGKDKMEELYFNSDLKSLIKSLSEFETEENVISFIKDLDTLTRNDITLPFLNSEQENIIYNIDISKASSKKFFDSLYNIYSFLFSCIKTKLIKIKEEVDFQEYKKNIDFLFEDFEYNLDLSINDGYQLSKINVEVIDKNDIENFINEQSKKEINL